MMNVSMCIIDLRMEERENWDTHSHLMKSRWLPKSWQHSGGGGMKKICQACETEIDNDFNHCRECGEIVEPVEIEDDEDEPS